MIPGELSESVTEDGPVPGYNENGEAVELIDVNEVLLWCFYQNYHLDKSNACVHCSPVRFSPLTFRLYEVLIATWSEDEDITKEMAEVKHHHGTYEEDKGR